jgi:hypothetical protein
MLLSPIIHELSFVRRWRTYLFAASVVVANVVYGLAQVPNTAFLNHVALFGYMLTTPLTPILPIVAALIGCLPMYTAVGHRFVANTRARMSVRTFLSIKLIGAFAMVFFTFFLVAFIPFSLCFYVWPAIGDPGINPEVYGMSTAEAALAELGEYSYSNLLAINPLVFGLGYSLWLGVGAATYAGLGVAALVFVPNRNVAILLPFIVYLLQTVVSGLLGEPHLGLLYSLLPFGLQQTTVLAAAAPQLALLAIVAIIWGRIALRANREPRLA